MNIGAWLHSLGMQQYEAAFRDNAIDAAVLPELTGDDLKDLGVSLVGHRRKLLAAIAALRSDPGAPPDSAAADASGGGNPLPIPLRRSGAGSATPRCARSPVFPRLSCTPLFPG